MPGRVVQCHTEEQEGALDGLPHAQEGHERYRLMDRADTQSHQTALSTGIPHGGEVGRELLGHQKAA